MASIVVQSSSIEAVLRVDKIVHGFFSIHTAYQNSAEGGIAPAGWGWVGGSKAVATPLIRIKYRSRSQGAC